MAKPSKLKIGMVVQFKRRPPNIRSTRSSAAHALCRANVWVRAIEQATALPVIVSRPKPLHYYDIAAGAMRNAGHTVKVRFFEHYRNIDLNINVLDLKLYTGEAQVQDYA